jgi:transcriptional regulator with GAF, ATPase, and Fis domain
LLSLDAFAATLAKALESASGSDRHTIETDLVWCQVERGELGAAFSLMWEATDSPALAGKRKIMRAELQAYCGNEDAALALVADAGEGDASVALVRARVAASRGDWETASKHALGATNATLESTRARLLATRANIELGRIAQAMEILESSVWRNPVEELHGAALRAAVDGEGREQALERIAERAGDWGARRLCAEAWADLSATHRALGNREEACGAAIRAVELWDDMATTLAPPLRAGFWCDAKRRDIRETSRRDRAQEGASPQGALESLLHNLRRLTSERDLSELLKVITDGAVALSGAERGFVLLVDESGALAAKTIRGAEAELGPQTAAFSRSIAETVLIDRDPVVTVDAAQDARVQDYMSVHQLMLKSVACLPIESRDRVWGVLYLEHRSASGRFTGADLSLLRAYADQAAIAIETSRLLERIETQRQALERANSALRDANAHLEQKVVGQATALERTRKEIASLQAPTLDGDRWGLLGVSDGMRRIYAVLDRVASNDVPVVVTGESGTGKELVARAIHRGSARSEEAFVSFNCGAIPEGLVETELFGHVAGAFTGARHTREGLFQQANGGTLLLDEIADMPMRMQLDLLRVLQERRVRPVGGSEEIPVDVRLVTASKRPLKELVAEGTLREDLYYRLAVVELQLPPLRARRTDIPLLADHFLGRIAEEGSEPKKRLSRAALQRLGVHDFPGNVRELEHLLINASLFASGDTIEAEDLAIETGRATQAPSTEASTYVDFKESERDRILATLNAHGWNRAKAARALGMARRTFYRRLKEHGIELRTSNGTKG